MEHFVRMWVAPPSLESNKTVRHCDVIESKRQSERAAPQRGENPDTIAENSLLTLLLMLTSINAYRMNPGAASVVIRHPDRVGAAHKNPS